MTNRRQFFNSIISLFIIPFVPIKKQKENIFHIKEYKDGSFEMMGWCYYPPQPWTKYEVTKEK